MHLPLPCDSQDEGLPPHNHSTINNKPKKTNKPLILSNAVSSVVLKISFVAVLKFLVLFKILTQTPVKVCLLDLVILVPTKAILNAHLARYRGREEPILDQAVFWHLWLLAPRYLLCYLLFPLLMPISKSCGAPAVRSPLFGHPHPHLGAAELTQLISRNLRQLHFSRGLLAKCIYKSGVRGQALWIYACFFCEAVWASLCLQVVFAAQNLSSVLLYHGSISRTLTK